MHCNNAPPVYVQNFMANESLTVGLGPPSSPYLTTCDNFFSDTQTGNELKEIPEQPQLKLVQFQTQDVHQCFQQQCGLWSHCTKTQENYFEGHSMEQKANADYN